MSIKQIAQLQLTRIPNALFFRDFQNKVHVSPDVANSSQNSVKERLDSTVSGRVKSNERDLEFHLLRMADHYNFLISLENENIE